MREFSSTKFNAAVSFVTRNILFKFQFTSSFLHEKKNKKKKRIIINRNVKSLWESIARNDAVRSIKPGPIETNKTIRRCNIITRWRRDTPILSEPFWVSRSEKPWDSFIAVSFPFPPSFRRIYSNTTSTFDVETRLALSLARQTIA